MDGGAMSGESKVNEEVVWGLCGGSLSIFFMELEF